MSAHAQHPNKDWIHVRQGTALVQRLRERVFEHPDQHLFATGARAAMLVLPNLIGRFPTTPRQQFLIGTESAKWSVQSLDPCCAGNDIEYGPTA